MLGDTPASTLLDAGHEEYLQRRSGKHDRTDVSPVAGHPAGLPGGAKNFKHTLTDKGIVAFQADWKKAKEAAAAKG